MTFLELCQAAARESGTIPNGGINPLTTAGQTGRLAKVVSWTAQAWTNLQNHRTDWQWMRAEFSGPVSVGSARYAPAVLNITRFASWTGDDGCYQPTTMFNTALGAVDETALRQISWETWRYRFGRGPQSTGRPVNYAFAPNGDLCIGPWPDAAYTLRGEYIKSAQLLTANADVPELPARFHMAIAWQAVILLHMHDEGTPNVATAAANADMTMRDIEHSQLPSITTGTAS